MGVDIHSGKGTDRRAGVESPFGPGIFHHLCGGQKGDRPNEGVAADTVVVVEEMPMTACRTLARPGGSRHLLHHIEGRCSHHKHAKGAGTPLPNHVSGRIAAEQQASYGRRSPYWQFIPAFAKELGAADELAKTSRRDAVLPSRLHGGVKAGVGHKGPSTKSCRQAHQTLAGIEVGIVAADLGETASQGGMGGKP